jgi:hypothetical protein
VRRCAFDSPRPTTLLVALIRLITRRGNDWTTRYLLVAEAVNHLTIETVGLKPLQKAEGLIAYACTSCRFTFGEYCRRTGVGVRNNLALNPPVRPRLRIDKGRADYFLPNIS